MSTRQTKLRDALVNGFPEASIEIEDDSARHAGHASAGGGGHFNVNVIWPGFEGLNRVARHRAVYAAAGDLMQTEIHALAVVAQTPEEVAH